jgi:hypothetical protein
LSNTLSRKPSLEKRGQRGGRIEYALIALLLAFAGLQVYFVFGAKGI